MNLESGVLQVHVEDIIPNRFQPRLNFDEQGLKELADSIREHGIIQPLVLRKLGEKYEIIYQLSIELDDLITKYYNKKLMKMPNESIYKKIFTI